MKDIQPGQCASVRALYSTGSMRRRLLDIGLVEHTPVRCLGRSPGGDPSAYLIRGAVIATIRSEDCENIIVDPVRGGVRMGLTNRSVGIHAADSGLELKKHSGSDLVVAIAGNPNVGKSTVFNGLTGMNQHTGNWPGKTVASAQGYCQTKDIPM